MTNYVPGVYRTGRGRTITGTKRKGYNDGEARTGHSMLTYTLLRRNPSSMAVGPGIGTSTMIAEEKIMR